MKLWYGMDLRPIGPEEANKLLADLNARRIALTLIATDRGRVEVSTVFLVLDHAWDGGDPILWETMVFGGPIDAHQWRYRSLAEAEDGHREAVLWAKSVLDLDGAEILAEETVDCVHG